MASPFFTGDKVAPGDAGDWEPAAGPGKPAAGAGGQDQVPLDWKSTGSIPETPSSTSSSGWRSEPGRARPGARGMRAARRSGSTAASEAAPLVEFASYRGMVVMEFCEAGARRRGCGACREAAGGASEAATVGFITGSIVLEREHRSGGIGSCAAISACVRTSRCMVRGLVRHACALRSYLAA